MRQIRGLCAGTNVCVAVANVEADRAHRRLPRGEHDITLARGDLDVHLQGGRTLTAMPVHIGHSGPALPIASVAASQLARDVIPHFAAHAEGVGEADPAPATKQEHRKQKRKQTGATHAPKIHGQPARAR